MSWLWLYKKSMSLGEPVIRSLLHYRARKGKENPLRLHERRGEPSLLRPSGPLIWVHVASVGEALSMLTLINLILEQIPQAHILVTSITTTAAQMLETRLPKPRAFHQFAPVDHPDWVRAFLDHWKPDLALWAESEIWPNTLTLLKKRNIPIALVNAHMSEKSFSNWSRVPRLAEDVLSVFTVILAQSEQDAKFYRTLGGRSVVVTDNIKYSAAPLPYDPQDLEALQSALGTRPAWLYASTHDAEEALACEVHTALQARFPAGYVHPKSIETLRRHGVDPGAPRSKSWDEFAGQNFDLVVTVCDQAAGETCPFFPGQPEKLHWSTPDPAKVTGTDAEIEAAFDNAFFMLKDRIEKLMKT